MLLHASGKYWIHKIVVSGTFRLDSRTREVLPLPPVFVHRERAATTPRRVILCARQDGRLRCLFCRMRIGGRPLIGELVPRPNLHRARSSTIDVAGASLGLSSP